MKTFARVDRYAACQVSGGDDLGLLATDSLAIVDFLRQLAGPDVLGALTVDAPFMHRYYGSKFLDWGRGVPTVKPEARSIRRLGELLNLLANLRIGPELQDILNAAEQVRADLERRQAAKPAHENVTT